jgi:hypothetical protein
MATNVGISKDSVQMPYRVFLEDGAIGLVVILITIAAYHTTLITRQSLGAMLEHEPVSPEVRVLVAVLVVLLAPAIGFVGNAMSWLLLDRAVGSVTRWCFVSVRSERAFPAITEITETRLGREVADAFNLNDTTFVEAGWMFRDVIDAYAATRFESQAHIEGLIIFLRNLALLAATLSVVSVASATTAKGALLAALTIALGIVIFLTARYERKLKSVLCLIVAAGAILTSAAWLAGGISESRWVYQAVGLAALCFVCTAIAGFVQYYYHLSILFHAYLICFENRISLSKPSVDRKWIAKQIAAAAGRRP